MEVHARIDESDIGEIRKGQSAVFTVDAYPGRQFDGVVVQIRKAPVVIQNVVTYTVVIGAKNEELLLLPGMTALVSVIVMESKPSLLVPTTAIHYEPSPRGVNDGILAAAADGDAESVVWRLDENDTPGTNRRCCGAGRWPEYSDPGRSCGGRR